jgi:hypothetical protein
MAATQAKDWTLRISDPLSDFEPDSIRWSLTKLRVLSAWATKIALRTILSQVWLAGIWLNPLGQQIESDAKSESGPEILRLEWARLLTSYQPVNVLVCRRRRR